MKYIYHSLLNTKRLRERKLFKKIFKEEKFIHLIIVSYLLIVYKTFIIHINNWKNKNCLILLRKLNLVVLCVIIINLPVQQLLILLRLMYQKVSI